MSATAGIQPEAREGSAGLLQILETSLDDLRSLITCRICIRPLYEPYTIECGHTFCYSCLRQWFDRDRTKKTCPDCRADVIRQPAPAYLVREITQIFLSRAELVPIGETTEEHRRVQQEEAEVVELDKANHTAGGLGLFKGRFGYFARPDRRTAPIIRDTQDGVDRCPNCAWELEEGYCGQCGFPHSADDLGPLSDTLSEDNSDYDDEYIARRSLDPRRRILDLGHGGSDIDYFSDTDVSFTDYANRHNIDLEELAAMDRIAPRRGRRHVLSDSDNELESQDDEDSGSLDDFIVRDIQELHSSRGEPSISHFSDPAVTTHDDRRSDYGMSSEAGSSHIGSPSTRYDTEEVTGIDQESSARTNASDDDGFPNESSLGQIGISSNRTRGTRLGGSRARPGRARRPMMPGNSRQDQSNQYVGSEIRGNTLEESDNESDNAPLVRTRRRARIQRLSSSSDSDSIDPGTRALHGSSPSRRSWLRNNKTSGRGFTPLHPGASRNQRGSGSSNGTSRGVPIEIASDSDAPVPPQRLRRRRVVSQDFSDNDQTSTSPAMDAQTRGSQSSSGTATIGRQSPAQDTTMSSNPRPPSPRRLSNSPILIESSPTGPEEPHQNPPAIGISDSWGSPDVSNNLPSTTYHDESPSTRADKPPQPNFYVAVPPRQSPRPRHRPHRIPSRTVNRPLGSPSHHTGFAVNSDHLVAGQIPGSEPLSRAERRREQAINDEAARRSARKVEKKRLKRERRQRVRRAEASVDPFSNDPTDGGAYDRRW